MRSAYRFSWVFGIFVLLAWPLGAAAQQERPIFVPDEIIVGFQDQVGDADARATLARAGLSVLRRLLGTGALLAALPDGLDPVAAGRLIRSLPGVAYAEPNYYRYINAVPNDPQFPALWGLHNTTQTGGTEDADIDAPEAWDRATGSGDVVVAVIDSGTDIDHEDLAANIFRNEGEYGIAGELSNNNIDDDGNGFIDDVNGWDFRGNDNNPRDNAAACVGHGTHTAGTVGAVGDNNIGVTGVAQSVKIMPLRVLGPVLLILCAGTDSDIIDAIGYAAMMGVDASNNSYGGGASSNAVRNAIARARHLFVTSAGNDGTDNDANPAYPASYDLDHIMAVAATNHNDGLAGFSNFGDQSVDLGAPGVGILSTLPGDDYGNLSGTSMASPHVAGAAAVLLSWDPDLTVHELKYRLNAGTDFTALETITGGRLNLYETLVIGDSEVVVEVTPVGSTAISFGARARVDVRVENTSGAVQNVVLTVRAWTVKGTEVTWLTPTNLVLNPGEVFQKRVRKRIRKRRYGAGELFVIGRVTNGADIFDEDQATYDVN